MLETNSYIFLLLVAVVTSSEVCPVWNVLESGEDNITHCKCGSDLNGIVTCSNDMVSILTCYCMTYNRQLNKTLVGRCSENCFNQGLPRLHPVQINTTESLYYYFCRRFKREGQLCGKCMKGYGPPVYSYSYQCVECDKANFTYNLLKYIAVAFVPLTGFYLIVIALKIRATAGFMVAYVMICQLASVPFLIRSKITWLLFDGNQKRTILNKSVISVISIMEFGCSSLSVFSLLYPP